MSTPWDYWKENWDEHQANKPYAPENGQPLKFKVGDPVILTHENGIETHCKVRKLFAVEEPETVRGEIIVTLWHSQYAKGSRYYLTNDTWWIPYKESSLRLDEAEAERLVSEQNAVHPAFRGIYT